jgi:hypothetical protein
MDLVLVDEIERIAQSVIDFLKIMKIELSLKG